MKTKLASLLMVLFLTTTIQLSAQRRVTVEAVNNDISYSLDLKAVASIFGDSRTLEDFERRLNDYDAQISNLDLNSDGEIDYLRVIETSENNLHLIVIQAILDRDVYQDVATIVVERDRYRRTYVQVIGDPYMYGYNYIIEPVYLRTPRIFSWFWTPRYKRWYSPYYWGYYPRHYHHRRPIEINLYLTHINHHINHRHNYRYSENIRNEQAYRLRNSVSRNDYGVRYPDREFSKRNANVKNRYEIDRRPSNASRSNNNIEDRDRRAINNNNRTNNNSGRNADIRNERGARNENNRMNSNSEINNRSNREEKAAPTRNSNTERYNRNYDSNNSGSVNRSSSNRENREQQKASRNEERPVKANRELNRRNERSVEAAKPARENKSESRSESRSERRSDNNERRSNSDSNNSRR
ncbi:MAG: hypothetical protein KA370_02110 [Paludibacter sp.]|nr:hypothetical protein [Paludibacter sp.]